jgi:pilus assembly protein CpaF
VSSENFKEIDIMSELDVLEPLLNDAAVTEILVDGPDRVYVEKRGQFEDVASPFRDQAHLLAVIEAILQPMGLQVDSANPLVDARLPDGSRANIVLPPIAIDGPTLVIRKFSNMELSAEDLIGFGSVTAEMMEFLEACVIGRLNMFVSGGTGSGKTTVLNILANYIPDGERILAIQSGDELHIDKKYLVKLETRPPNLAGKGAVTATNLVLNALKMRPDRLILAEARGEEVLHLVQGMNSGHDGSMTSIHANSPRDALNRLETMATMAGLSVPLLTIRQQLATAVQVITHQARLPDGSRKLLAISEVVGMQGDTIMLKEIFKFRESGVEDGKIIGRSVATGYIPTFMKQIHNAGIYLPMEMFRPS